MDGRTMLYHERKLAPYLEVKASMANRLDSDRNRNGSSSGADADAAAGTGRGLAKRVGSFNLLPRTLSTGALRSSAKPSEPKTAVDDREKTEKDASTTSAAIKPDWRLADKMKTVGMGLVMALNIGTDPPDMVKPHPCAVLQCWIDPHEDSRGFSLERIGERLEEQYAKCQQTRVARPMRRKRVMDPTVEEVRSLCLQLRRHARNDRVLFHYNGHGVPRPTENGELWAFDKQHTEYIPFSIADLRRWLGKPSIVVLDCSSAGVLVPFFTASLGALGGSAATPAKTSGLDSPTTTVSAIAQALVNDTIVVCPCSEGEWIPMHPDYPADIFTACLTTPLKVALRWFVRRNPHSMSGLDPEAVEFIPGDTSDRTTPLGELNWIFAAVTDSIAWNVLPKALFQRLFRQDLMVASIFRNFLLADRVLRTLGCTPVSHPRLPPGIAHHPLWKSWDLTCETLLVQLMKDGIIGNHVLKVDKDGDESHDIESLATQQPPPPVETAPLVTTRSSHSAVTTSPFFSEHLTAFEVWLGFSSIHKMHLELGTLKPPESLPIVLQVLLGQAKRIRALHLLRRFLDLGPWAVNLSLSLGIFPYVLRLLSSPDYKSLLVSIWASILAFDSSCRFEMIKSRAFQYFAQHLTWGLNGSVNVEASEAANERTLAAFDLAVACHGYPQGQSECISLNLQGSVCALLLTYQQGDIGNGSSVELSIPARFRMWLCICIGNIAQNNAPTQAEVFSAGVHSQLFARLKDKDAEVRAAACYAIGCLMSSKRQGGKKASSKSPMNEPSTAQNLSALIPHQALPPGIIPAGARMTHMQPPGFGQQSVGVQWSPQVMHAPVAGQPIALQGQHFVGQPTAFLGQPGGQVSAISGQAIQPHFLMQGQALQSNALAAPGFLVGPNSALSSGQPSLVGGHLLAQQHPSAEPRQFQMSLYEDRDRFRIDIACLGKILEATEDASVIVRYEATVALANYVGKYSEAFVSTAQADASSATPILEDDRDRALFSNAWNILRSLQRHDPFPPIRKVANTMASFVFEHVLQKRAGETGGARKLSGIDEELSQDDSGLGTPPATRHAASPSTVGARPKEKSDLRRVASEILPGVSGLHNSSDTSKTASDGSASPSPLEYRLPTSSFFEWKKSSFHVSFGDQEANRIIDPLSPDGAGHIYQSQRNTRVMKNLQTLSKRYNALAPKPPTVRRGSIEEMLKNADDSLLAVEKEAAARKKELEVSQTKLLKNSGDKMTSMIHFHSFEDILMACGSTDSISMWDTNTGERLKDFVNGNTKKSKMTTSTWIEEETSGVFLTGCDDGTVRVWGNLIEKNGDPCLTAPKMLSAFKAVPMISDGPESGLVCEWQPSSRQLLAGGNSKEINCWDLTSEQKFNVLRTESTGDLTALCTTWDYDALGTGSSTGRGYQGFGSETVVGGFSDGSLKIFDLRLSGPANDISGTPRVRRRITGYQEHDSWIVSVTFPGYGGRYEVISGTVSGEIKAWDLRMSSSTRTLDVQRSIMTSFAVHPKIPMLATGSHAQFIKLLALDGDTMQVIRYHELTGMKSHRIGPVSCLSFHRYKPLLAAGAADPLIGLYSTKQIPFG